MRNGTILISLLVMSCVLGCQHLPQERARCWSDVTQIPVMDKDIPTFLDIDLAAHEKQAFDAYQQKRYEEAAAHYLFLLQHDIHNAGAIYNLACCYGLLGNEELAAQFLERSVREGMEDIRHIGNDPDFELVRGKPVFEAAMKRIETAIMESHKSNGEQIFFESNTLLYGRLHLPEAFIPEKVYPLIIGLHGFGASAENFSALWDVLQETQALYCVPHAPFSFAMGKELGYSWKYPTDDETLARQSITLSIEYILNTIKTLSTKYRIGDVYLLGFSQGAGLAYQIGLQHPDRFKGIICFGGWLDTDMLSDQTLAAAKNVRVFIGHGKEDRMVEFKEGADARDKLLSLGYNVTMWEFDGGHRVPEEGLKEVITWLGK